MLAEVSGEEDAVGRGMLSVLVVYKDGDQMPSSGFFTLAQELGYNAADKEACWITQANKVFKVWRK